MRSSEFLETCINKRVLTFDHITHKVVRIAPYVEKLEPFARDKLAKGLMGCDANKMSVLLQPLS